MSIIKDDSVLAGAEYSAVLQLTTPLRFLLKEGTVSQDPLRCRRANGNTAAGCCGLRVGERWGSTLMSSLRVPTPQR